MPFSDKGAWIPSPTECRELWDKYSVPDHIRRHSTRVGEIARALAQKAEAKTLLPPGMSGAVYASGLLHDIAKLYCIEHGGCHAHIGASWVLAETGSPALAQGVMHHVWWPFEVDPTHFFLPLAVLYADKRVRHDEIVSLGARYTDLFERYGSNAKSRKNITISMKQAQAVEHTLGELLEVKLHASTFDSGRLVL